MPPLVINSERPAIGGPFAMIGSGKVASCSKFRNLLRSKTFQNASTAECERYVNASQKSPRLYRAEMSPQAITVVQPDRL